MIVRLMIAGVLMATIGLAGCGKKGPLEPPKVLVSMQIAH